MRMRLGIPRIAQVSENVRNTRVALSRLSPRTKLAAIAGIAMVLALMPVLFTLLPAPSAPAKGKVASASNSSTSSSTTGASGTTGTSGTAGTTGSKGTATSTHASSAPATSAPATSAPGGTYLSGPPHGCLFEKADQPLHVALCDSFSQPMPTANTRSGDLNGVVWGVSRVSNETNPPDLLDGFAPVALNKCGATVTVTPPRDVAICNGQLVEGVNDGGNQTVLAMYPKQPFDIAGRTGTVTFDVSADSEGPHAAWPTFVYTDQPVPAPYSLLSGVETSARNSFGFTIASPDYITGNASDRCGGNGTTVDTMFVTRNYQLSDLPFNEMDCAMRPSSPGQLNHFEIRISRSQVQVWASDPGSTTLREIAQADNANLPLTRGLIWIEDAHYDADKFNDQGTHTFGWDNVGFDGPVLPRDLAFDAPNNTVMNGGDPQLGWATDATVQTPNVSNVSQAAAALVTFDWFPFETTVPSISVNGNPAIATPWPFTGDMTTDVWRTIAIAVPLSEIRAGVNTIAFSDPGSSVAFANVDLILVGAGGVPTCVDPSTC